MQRLLPSLDLKRRQLMMELARAGKDAVEADGRLRNAADAVGQQLPMLASGTFEVSGLLRIRRVSLGEENAVGVKLPFLQNMDFEERPYSVFLKPHWVDTLVLKLKEIAELKARHEVSLERVRRLEYGVRRITQRVNLFDKVLIPRTKSNISRIQIFIGDAERSAVIRAKIAKSRNVSEAKALL